MSLTPYNPDNDADEIVKIEPIAPSAIQTIVSAETDIQVTTAKKYPRDVARSYKYALSMATIDEETAQTCLYALPRGGKTIEGPSIRLAEIFSVSWGNLRVEARVVEINDKFVVARGVCWDLEANIVNAVSVQRRITGRNGQRFDDDMINVTSNAACAIARRNAIFATVPRTYINKIYDQCKRVVVGDAKTLSQKRSAFLDWLAKAGIPKAQVFAYFGVEGEEGITLRHCEVMAGTIQSIKSGDASADEVFKLEAKEDPQPKTEKTAKVGESVKDKMRAKTIASATAASVPTEAEITTAHQSLGINNDQLAFLAEELSRIEGAPSAPAFIVDSHRTGAKNWDDVMARFHELEAKAEGQEPLL